MTQPSPTPAPDHGTGWGLLLLFVYLYGVVALLGVGTVLAVAADAFDRRVPGALRHLLAVVLLGALGISGFAVLVAATARTYDVVALLLAVVFVPLALVALRHRSVLRRRGPVRGGSALLARAATAWSVPFLAGFGLIAVAGAQASSIPPEFVGVLAAVVVIGGTIVVERLPFVPDVAADSPGTDSPPRS